MTTKTTVIKETTLTVNKKNNSYGFRKGNCFFTRDDVHYYDKIYAVKGKGITPECEEKIRAKFPDVKIEFILSAR